MLISGMLSFLGSHLQSSPQLPLQVILPEQPLGDLAPPHQTHLHIRDFYNQFSSDDSGARVDDIDDRYVMAALI